MNSSSALILVTSRLCILLSWNLFGGLQLFPWLWYNGAIMWKSIFDVFWALVFDVFWALVSHDACTRKKQCDGNAKNAHVCRHYQPMYDDWTCNMSFHGRYAILRSYDCMDHRICLPIRCSMCCPQTFWGLLPVRSKTESAARSLNNFELAFLGRNLVILALYSKVLLYAEQWAYQINK